MTRMPFAHGRLLVDMGPGAGSHGGDGGRPGHAGRRHAVRPTALTGQYLTGHRQIDVPK